MTQNLETTENVRFEIRQPSDPAATAALGRLQRAGRRVPQLEPERKREP
jgi:hypothetical protein